MINDKKIKFGVEIIYKTNGEETERFNPNPKIKTAKLYKLPEMELLKEFNNLDMASLNKRIKNYFDTTYFLSGEIV